MTTGPHAPTLDPPTRTPIVRPLLAWTILIMLVLFIVVNWADKAILGLVATPVMKELGIGEAEFGFIGSSFYFLFSITGMLVGFLANRLPTRWILLVMALLWSATQLPVVLLTSAGALLFSRISLGAAEGPSGALANNLAFTWFPNDRRAVPSALISSGASIAKIAIAPVLTLVIVAWGWRSAFWALIAFGVVWSVAWLLIGKEGPYGTRTDEDRAAVTDTQADRPVPFRHLALNGTFIGACLGTFTQYAMVTVILTWFPAYMEDGLGFSQAQSGFLFGLPSITAMTAMVGGGALTDRVLRRGVSSRKARAMVSMIGMIIGGAILLAMPLAPNRYVAIVFLVTGYGVTCLAIPLMAAAVGALAPARQRSGVLGLYLAIQNSSGIVAPLVTGLIVGAAATEVLGYTHAFQVWGAVVIVGGLLIGWLVHPERDIARIATRQPSAKAK